MNKNQKVIFGIALTVFALTLLAAPWTVTPPPTRQIANIMTGESYMQPHASYSETGPIWDGPHNGQLNSGALLIEWAAIAIVGGGVFAMLRQKH